MMVDMRRADGCWEVAIDKRPVGTFMRMTDAVAFIERTIARHHGDSRTTRSRNRRAA
ncbi:hypothetical protein [Brevibacterium samyangense]|uniref:DUF2188 domain-containing protein n=1 Tax=Brevibacterium samyangense TaxID=366888 RepID=A0ABN2T5H2_9MICO